MKEIENIKKDNMKSVGNIVISTTCDSENNPTMEKGMRNIYESKNNEYAQDKFDGPVPVKLIAALRLVKLLGPKGFGTRTTEKTNVDATRIKARNKNKKSIFFVLNKSMIKLEIRTKKKKMATNK
ncbi:hypothetical protein MUP77_23085 [Candidatus Bathyarchaeota archaeon]|nr:hypothetical protein [Candidatus Bathyarchaeota archaeon]